MTALFYGDLASKGKTKGLIFKLDKTNYFPNYITDSVVLVNEISQEFLPCLLLHRPKALIVENSSSDVAWQKFYKSIPIPTVSGLRGITKYFDNGDEVVVDCENLVVIGKMIGEKFDW